MIVSLVSFFKAPRKLDLWQFPGKGVHGWFLEQIERIDPSLSARLHEAKEKAFTVSSILAASPQDLCSGEGTHWIRITSLEEELSEVLVSLKAGDLGALRVEGTELEVTETLWDNHPWAARSSYTELYNNGLIWARKRKEDTIGLCFVTPTAFRMVNTRLNMPLPWPRLVFQSLANKWNAFAPMQLWINWADFDRQVTVARFDLKTKLLDFGGFRQVGFVGECWFLIDPEARVSLRHALYTLAQFAFYAGVGRKTTMGMGMVRPLGSRDA